MHALSPALTVVVTTYNRDEYLAQALASLREQTVTVQDVVVVDDGGSGNARSVVARLGAPFRYLRQPNSGQQAARNLGIAQARGDWVTFLDDDDLWTADRHAALLEAAASGEADAWYSDCARFVDGADVPGTLFGDFLRTRPGYFGRGVTPGARRAVLDDFPLEHLIPIGPFWAGSMLLVRRQAVLDIGGWDTRLRGVTSEDLEFTYRVLRRLRTGILWAPTVRYRCHPGNDSASEYAVAKGRAEVWRYVLEAPGTPDADRAVIARSLQPVYRALFWQACQRGARDDALAAFRRMDRRSRTLRDHLRLAWTRMKPRPA
jgi:glycosyltransferase involved in cell wall biosynthesis